MRIAGLVGMLTLAACAPGLERGPEAGASAVDYRRLAGWPPTPSAPSASPGPAAALGAYARACERRGVACPVAAGAAPAEIEAAFQPMLLKGAGDALLTGYYEPVIEARRAPDAAYDVPLHAMPSGGDPLPTRAEIDAGALAGRSLELFWLADPVERFFLQVQGSGRLRLEDGSLVRVGYAGRNGHPYRSIGRLLVDRGEMASGSVTADRLRAWLAEDPARGAALMHENPSYVFFREAEGLAPEDGPIGSLGVPLIAGVSVAVDPERYPLGSLLWLEAETPDGPIARLVVAEDTGSAIRGPGRIDLFVGTGDAAGLGAGRLSHPARIVLLVPRDEAPRS